MEILEIVLVVLMIVAAAVLTFAVLKQPSKSQGLSGAISGGSSDTYYGKGKGKDKEKMWNKVTIILSAFFVVITLAFFILQPTIARPDYGDKDSMFNAPDSTPVTTTTTAPSSSETPVSSDTPASSEAPTNDQTPNE